MEAIKQGSACVGLRSKDYVVLAAIRMQKSELSSYQQKLFKVDDHIGIGISGLNADARVIRKYLIDGAYFGVYHGLCVFFYFLFFIFLFF